MIPNLILKTKGRTINADFYSNGLDLLNNLNKIPKYSGVYLFLHTPRGKYTYIGSSNNMQERIKTHLGFSKKYKNGNKNLFFDFFKYPKEYHIQCCLLGSEKEYWEYTLIDAYQPLYNRFGRMPSTKKLQGGKQ